MKLGFGISVGVLLFAVAASPTRADLAAEVAALHAERAEDDREAIREQIGRLAALARRRIAEVGLEAALGEFMADPWRRDANGLHLWGVTRTGVSWFDAGHPELVGLDVSEMSDIEGRNWSRLAWESGAGTGARVFDILFPHPMTQRSTRGLHECWLVGAGDRVLCAGGFADPPG